MKMHTLYFDTPVHVHIALNHAFGLFFYFAFHFLGKKLGPHFSSLSLAVAAVAEKSKLTLDDGQMDGRRTARYDNR